LIRWVSFFDLVDREHIRSRKLSQMHGSDGVEQGNLKVVCKQVSNGAELFDH
jgi:hypothetical protein